MAFWGIVVKGGERKQVGVTEDEVLHLSQICLNEPKPGKNYLQVETKGSTYTFACLEKDKVEHSALDLFFESGTTFINKGSSEVHMSGYFEPKDDGDDDEGEEEEESDEGEAGAAPKKKSCSDQPCCTGAAKAEAKASPKAQPKASPKAEPKASPKAAPKAAAKGDAKKDEEEDSDIDEMEEGEEEEMEGDESEEAEEEEEVKEPPTKKAKVAAGKAAAEAEPKAKAEAKAKASPKAAAKGAMLEPANESEYISTLVQFLKTNGETKMDQIGSKIKKPDGVQKLKPLLAKNQDKFKVENGLVSAK